MRGEGTAPREIGLPHKEHRDAWLGLSQPQFNDRRLVREILSDYDALVAHREGEHFVVLRTG